MVVDGANATAVRHERERPGAPVHIDVKKLTPIPKGGSWRANGRREEVRGRGVGYGYAHSMVDEDSRLAGAELLPDETGETCAGFLARAAAVPLGVVGFEVDPRCQSPVPGSAMGQYRAVAAR